MNRKIFNNVLSISTITIFTICFVLFLVGIMPIYGFRNYFWFALLIIASLVFVSCKVASIFKNTFIFRILQQVSLLIVLVILSVQVIFHWDSMIELYSNFINSNTDSSIDRQLYLQYMKSYQTYLGASIAFLCFTCIGFAIIITRSIIFYINNKKLTAELKNNKIS